jgi:hypothetical protein
MLKEQFGDDIDKVHAVTAADGEQVYVLVTEPTNRDEDDELMLPAEVDSH